LASVIANEDNNPVNVGIHIVFVPTIYASAIILAALLPSVPIASNIPKISIADVTVLVYAVGYFLLEPVAGLLMLPFHLAVWYYAHHLPVVYPSETIVKWALSVHVTAWIAQFMGHGFAERRAPALLDNLFQVC